MQIITYLRVYHSKDDGLLFEGPFLGPEVEVSDVDVTAQTIVDEKPKAIMTAIKVYDFDGDYEKVTAESNDYFTRYKLQCVNSYDISVKPIMKSKNIGK